MSDSDSTGAPPRSRARGVDAPRALAFADYNFNFRVDAAGAIAARYGAPAFALRRSRLERHTTAFWAKLERQYAALWIAAQEGRIDEEGRELRPNLLNADGTDPIGLRDHRKRLFAARLDEQDHRVLLFNRAWTRQIDLCGLSDLAAEVEDYIVWFPVEARLPIDAESDSYVWMGLPWTPPVAPTRALVLARFPLR